MTSSVLRLYFIRLTGLLAQGALLISATVLFAFGMLELFNVLAFIGVALIWLMLRPAAARAFAAVQYEQHDLGEHVDVKGRLVEDTGAAPVTLDEFTRLWAVRARARARKALSLPRDRFDVTSAAVTTLVWFSYFGFISSVLAGA